MKRFVLALLVVVSAVASLPLSASADADCPDFATHEEAQAYFESIGGSPAYNADRLDADNDGIACESLPSGGGGGYSAPAGDTYVDPVADTSTSTTQPGVAVAPPAVNQAPQSQTLNDPVVDACAPYDAWTWAQTVFEKNPGANAGLDPDGNGIACEHLPIGGFAPVMWTQDMPDKAQQGVLISVNDGNVITVLLNGVKTNIRLQGVVAPMDSQCGADTSKAYLQWMLSLIPNGTVFVENDFAPDNNGENIVGYVWFEIGGDVYLANEAMARNGLGQPGGKVFNPLEKEFADAGTFAEKHQLGIYGECGGFGSQVS